MPSTSAIYAAHALAQAPRLLSLLDREPHSASYGSADREHWSWKFRDFPQGMLQWAAHPLALLWRHDLPENSYYQNPRVLEWIHGAMQQTLQRQHSDGSWDAFYPNERDPGVTLGVLHGLCETYRLIRDELPGDFHDSFLRAARRGFQFAARGDENHAFISNHWALFAVAWLDAQELLGDDACRRRADRCVERILAEQSPEGWYREYEGADPGYESLGISHLAAYWQRAADARVLDSLRRSVDFYAHCVHPDGSVAGVYGSRHPSLYFPAGFERLSAEVPMAAAIAQFMGAAISRNNVVTPATTDAENLSPLLSNYLLAAQAAPASAVALPLLPCESQDGVRHVRASGIIAAGTPRYYAVASSAKGGVCRIFDKRSRAILYEDAGYVAKTAAGTWTSQLIGRGIGKHSGAEVACETQFARATQRLPTPWNYWLFRALSLTLFRSLALGNWLRRRMIAQLVTRSHAGPLRLRRVFRFEPDRVMVEDRIEKMSAVTVQEISLPRSFTAIHMGSAKYFHSSELQSLPLPEVAGMAARLNRSGAAQRSWSLQWDARGACRFVEGAEKPKNSEVEIGATR